jgi:xanthine dehydrogenase accessory factor
MSDWIQSLRRSTEDGKPAVLVTVIEAKGSTPREAGTKMVVGRGAPVGTIGGGHLEYRALEIARGSLDDAAAAPAVVHEFPLGPSLGQCCGGHATLLFERITVETSAWLGAIAARADDYPAVVTRLDDGAKLIVTAAGSEGALGNVRLDEKAAALVRGTAGDGSRLESIAVDAGGPAVGLFLDFPPAAATMIALFGAGHVGKAIVGVLSALPEIRITWIDDRADEFPAAVPANVELHLTDAPDEAVNDLPAGVFALVMTHNHALDFKVVEKLLKRGDFRFCGLIGSQTKRARFIGRLAHRGVLPETIQRLTCPIGVSGVSGKHPAEIAIAAAAEILQVRDAASEAESAGELSA